MVNLLSGRYKSKTSYSRLIRIAKSTNKRQPITTANLQPQNTGTATQSPYLTPPPIFKRLHCELLVCLAQKDPSDPWMDRQEMTECKGQGIFQDFGRIFNHARESTSKPLELLVKAGYVLRYDEKDPKRIKEDGMDKLMRKNKGKRGKRKIQILWRLSPDPKQYLNIFCAIDLFRIWQHRKTPLSFPVDESILGERLMAMFKASAYEKHFNPDGEGKVFATEMRKVTTQIAEDGKIVPLATRDYQDYLLAMGLLFRTASRQYHLHITTSASGTQVINERLREKIIRDIQKMPVRIPFIISFKKNDTNGGK